MWERRVFKPSHSCLVTPFTFVFWRFFNSTFMLYHQELLSCSFLFFPIHFWRINGNSAFGRSSLGRKGVFGALNSLDLCIFLLWLQFGYPFLHHYSMKRCWKPMVKWDYLADFSACKPVTAQSFADRLILLISGTGCGLSREIFAPWSSRVCRPCFRDIVPCSDLSKNSTHALGTQVCPQVQIHLF